jgi:hypothetical protein
MAYGDPCLARAAADRYIGACRRPAASFFAGFAVPMAQANGAKSGGSA